MAIKSHSPFYLKSCHIEIWHLELGQPSCDQKTFSLKLKANTAKTGKMKRSRDKSFHGKRQHTHIYLLQIENPWHIKVQIVPKSNLVNQWVLLVLLTAIWVTFRCRNDSKTAASLSSPQHPWQLIKMETHSPLHSLQASQQRNVFSRWLSWSKLWLDTSSTGSCLFQSSWSGLSVFAAWLIWVTLSYL